MSKVDGVLAAIDLVTVSDEGVAYLRHSLRRCSRSWHNRKSCRAKGLLQSLHTNGREPVSFNRLGQLSGKKNGAISRRIVSLTTAFMSLQK
jgi:hypothetical protein